MSVRVACSRRPSCEAAQRKNKKAAKGKGGKGKGKDSDDDDELMALGRAVQVGPVKPKLKAPGTYLLTLKHDELLSSFAFKVNLRRYSWVACWAEAEIQTTTRPSGRAWQILLATSYDAL
jgi:hypothetical protein